MSKTPKDLENIRRFQAGKNHTYKNYARAIVPLIQMVAAKYPVHHYSELVALVDHEYCWLGSGTNWSLEGKPLTRSAIIILYKRAEVSLLELERTFASNMSLSEHYKSLNMDYSLQCYKDQRRYVREVTHEYWQTREEKEREEKVTVEPSQDLSLPALKHF